MKIKNIKTEAKRKIIQVVAFGFSNANIQNFAGGQIYKGNWKNFCNPGLNCYSCPAATTACPIGALQAVAGSSKFDFSFYVVGFLLALGVVFGRAICGFLCPFGLIQELIHKIPSPKVKLPKPFRYLKYVILIGFVIISPIAFTEFGTGAPAFCEWICPVGTLEAGIPLLATQPMLQSLVGFLFSWKMIILVITIVMCILCERFFCKALCPLGAIYGLINKVSLYSMKFMPQNCISCGKCAKVCPMDIDPTKAPNSIECIRCKKCVSACNFEALNLSFFEHKKKKEANANPAQ